MAYKRGALLNRLFFGKEKSEDYARSTLPTNRWELFWDVFKGSFGKLVLLNLLMILFFIPIVFLVIYREGLILNYAVAYPFSQGFGIGYGAPFTLAGYSENITFSVNVISMFLLPVGAIIGAIGLSGGAYVIRNMVWTEGVFVANDFWKGIKQNFKQIMPTALFYSLVFYLCILSISLLNQYIATEANVTVYVILKVVSIVILALFTLIALHMVTMCVTYKLPFIKVIKNSVILTFSLFLPNLLIVLAMALPFVLFIFGGFFTIIGFIVMLIFGFSYILLVWTVYSQWIYDKYINPRIKGAQKNRGIYEATKQDNDSFKKYKEQMLLRQTTSKYAKVPIKPITDDELKLDELPVSFNREDIIRLNESKERIYEDNRKYIEEHQNDEIYKVDTDVKEEIDKTKKRIEKAKKELNKRKK